LLTRGDTEMIQMMIIPQTHQAIVNDMNEMISVEAEEEDARD
jgi:hypothetical protein